MPRNSFTIKKEEILDSNRDIEECAKFIAENLKLNNLGNETFDLCKEYRWEVNNPIQKSLYFK